jgi:hypothetical protein
VSALLYALAFSVIFIIQEFFLVLPKAFTPGLKPILFHNNHDWTGTNPLAELEQGTGAVAILLVAGGLALVLRTRNVRSTSGRLWLVWLIYNGCFQSLPQVIVGAFLPRNDVGRAMGYLQFSHTTRLVAACAAFIALAIIGIRLAGPLLELAARSEQVATNRSRARFVFDIATVPVLLALPVILLFRIPGSIDQVLLVPLAVSILGLPWLQLGALGRRGINLAGTRPVRSVLYPAVFLIALLIFFQSVLRPGIRFY